MGMKHGRDHLSERDALALAAGDLPASEVAALQRHVGECAPCRREVEAALRLDAVLSVLDDVVGEAMARALEPRIRSTTCASPIGTLRVWASERGICRVQFWRGTPERARPGAAADPLLAAASAQLAEYFTGARREFDLPLDLTAEAPFQRQVLEETARIRFGSVATYGSLARALGRPRAARAVGGALHRNPVPIVIPCHRVVGASGSLVGYAGGLEAKRYLLSLEGLHFQASV